mmetsp:Transcript_98421/g.175286  ORF Transcript_98421/g.175286 Transcript_98421/m.175286 type:complete len:144 (+) Transcript_98421:83-514(+)
MFFWFAAFAGIATAIELAVQSSGAVQATRHSLEASLVRAEAREAETTTTTTLTDTSTTSTPPPEWHQCRMNAGQPECRGCEDISLSEFACKAECRWAHPGTANTTRFRCSFNETVNGGICQNDTLPCDMENNIGIPVHGRSGL